MLYLVIISHCNGIAFSTFFLNSVHTFDILVTFYGSISLLPDLSLYVVRLSYHRPVLALSNLRAS